MLNELDFEGCEWLRLVYWNKVQQYDASAHSVTASSAVQSTASRSLMTPASAQRSSEEGGVVGRLSTLSVQCGLQDNVELYTALVHQLYQRYDTAARTHTVVTAANARPVQPAPAATTPATANGHTEHVTPLLHLTPTLLLPAHLPSLPVRHRALLLLHPPPRPGAPLPVALQCAGAAVAAAVVGVWTLLGGGGRERSGLGGVSDGGETV